MYFYRSLKHHGLLEAERENDFNLIFNVIQYDHSIMKSVKCRSDKLNSNFEMK